MGLPYLDVQPYRASVYTDRGVYRPGETAHVAAIVRDAAHVAPPSSLPVVAKLVDPRGKELRKKVLQTNAGGLVAVDWSFGDYATLGMWKTVLAAGDQTIGETTFAVEEFVPERMKVDAGIEGQFAAEDPVPVAIAARWLFGGSAGGSEVELSCQVVPGAFKPKQNTTYRYGLADIDDGTDRRTTTLGTLTDRLDEEGRVTLECPPAARSGGFLGAATLLAQAAVFEGDSGRTTLGEARAPIHPERYYVGLSSSAGKVGSGEAIPLSGVIVDWDGALAPGATGTVTLELQRLQQEYVYTWDRGEQRYRYRRMLRRSLEESVEVPVQAGKFSTSLTPREGSSGYLVVAKSGNARTELYLEGKGYSYWWWGEQTTVDATPRPNKPGEIAVVVPESAQVGERVTVKATVPYAGRLLWTVETHEVLEFRWVDVAAGEVEWTFRVPAFVPNLYVGALLVKDPHLESRQAFVPDRAFGVKSLPIRPEEYVQAIRLDTPKEVRPYSQLEIGLDLGKQAGPSFVTVAAVDEGILSLTDFETPDPFDDIFAQRALGVDTYETVGWTLLVPPGGAGRSTGGDGDVAGKRVQMVKPVALWSGVVEVAADGKAKVTFEVPGYRGELRVMVVSASAKKMGFAEASVTVKDPIVLQTTLPRFLVAGDEALLPVFVSNVSGKARELVVDLSIEDLEDADERVSTAVGGDRPSPVVVVGDRQARLRLDDGASDTVLFRVRAQRAPGAAKFRVVATSDALRSLEEIELPVMRPEPEVRQTVRVALSPGANDLTATMAPWVDGSDRTRVWVTANPYGPALSHVREMVRYPYGCIEQTTSSTRPLLYVSTLLDTIDPALAKDQPVDKMVRYGIERILAMQTSQGGFAYWPGGGVPNEWGTAYATHLLLDAKQAGYAVPDRALADALDWLGRQVDRKGGLSEDDFTAPTPTTCSPGAGVPGPRRSRRSSRTSRRARAAGRPTASWPSPGTC
jgi:alpha-2-macroglobulin